MALVVSRVDAASSGDSIGVFCVDGILAPDTNLWVPLSGSFADLERWCWQVACYQHGEDGIVDCFHIQTCGGDLYFMAEDLWFHNKETMDFLM